MWWQNLDGLWSWFWESLHGRHWSVVPDHQWHDDQTYSSSSCMRSCSKIHKRSDTPWYPFWYTARSRKQSAKDKLDFTLPTRPNLMPYQILDKPKLSMVYLNNEKKMRFMRIKEIDKYNDGTLNLIKPELENRVNRNGRVNEWLPTTRAQDLLRQTLDIIEEKLQHRRMMRRMEKYMGLRNRRRFTWRPCSALTSFKGGDC